ncbi:MAG: hypothetical protein U0R69_13000 [Gaiellales bacterium]
MTSWRDEVFEEGADWLASSSVVLAFLIVPIAGGLLVLASRADKPLFKLVTGENRILETLQFIGYLTACVTAALVAVWLFRRRLGVPTTLWAAFALGCLLVAGEEIAWGQTYFDWETPEALEEINEQAQTTVHNIGPVQNVMGVILLLIGLYGIASPLVYRWRTGHRPGGLARLFVPPLFLLPAFLVLFGYKLIRLTVLTSDRFTLVELSEWPELCLAAALAGFSFLTLRWLRATQPVLGRTVVPPQAVPVEADLRRIDPPPAREQKLNKEA